MIKHFILINALLLLFVVPADAQDMQNKSSPVTKIRSLTKAELDSIGADPFEFFPMREGNYWEYEEGVLHWSESVLKDSLLESGRRLIYMREDDYPVRPRWAIDTNYFVIQDSWATYPIYYYKLDADTGDTWWKYGGEPLEGAFGKVEDIFLGNILGVQTIIKFIVFYFRSETSPGVYEDFEVYREYLAYGIGLVFQGTPPAPPQLLVGCIIDGDTIGTITSVEHIKEEAIPEEFSVKQNYPNPFNSSTRFEYSIKQAGYVKIYITDTLGEKVTVVSEGYKNAGEYAVDIDFDKTGRQLSAGLYLLTFNYNNKQKTIKMMYLK